MQNQRSTVASASATSNATAVLAELAGRASRHHGQSVAAWMRCAAVILEARKIAQHGDWSMFLRDAGIPACTANRMLIFAGTGIQIGHLAVLTRTEIAALIAQAHQDFPGQPPDSAYAKALVEAVIEIAGERGYDPGELARFITEFPNHAAPRTQ